MGSGAPESRMSLALYIPVAFQRPSWLIQGATLLLFEKVYRMNCSVLLFSILVQSSCSVFLFRVLTQYSCSIFLFRIIVQYCCSVSTDGYSQSVTNFWDLRDRFSRFCGRVYHPKIQKHQKCLLDYSSLSVSLFTLAA